MVADASNNRIWAAITAHVEEEMRFRVKNPDLGSRDRYATVLSLEYYRDLLHALRKDLSPDEKRTRVFLKNEIRKLKVQARPGILNYLLHGGLSRFLTNYLLGQYNFVRDQHKTLVHFQRSKTQEENFSQLTRAVKEAGFGQNIEQQLKLKLSHNLPKFHIRYADLRNPGTEYILHFVRQPGTQSYQFNSFDAAPSLGWRLAGKNQPASSWQTFDLRSEQSFNASQAAQLVNGRAICTDSASNLWTYLDQGYYKTYRTEKFDLRAAIVKLPLATPSENEVRAIENALRSGGKRETVLLINGKEEKFNLSAAPLHQKIFITDSNNRPVNLQAHAIQMKRQAELASQIVKQQEQVPQPSMKVVR